MITLQSQGTYLLPALTLNQAIIYVILDKPLRLLESDVYTIGVPLLVKRPQ